MKKGKVTMRQNGRSGQWKFIIGAVMFSAVFTFIAINVFSADYISEPVLVGTSKPIITVNVELKADPTEGPAPLKVTFTCTATAEVYYIETWAQPPQGSVDKEKEITKTYPAEITQMPVLEEPIREPGIYPFTAVAEYEDEEGNKGRGEDTVTVIVREPTCADLFARKAALEKELAKLNKQLEMVEKRKEEVKENIKQVVEKIKDVQWEIDKAVMFDRPKMPIDFEERQKAERNLEKLIEKMNNFNENLSKERDLLEKIVKAELFFKQEIAVKEQLLSAVDALLKEKGCEE